MGLTVITIDVGNPAKPKATVPVEFLVDSGAIYSVVPSSVLKKLGLRPLSEEIFTLANGEKIARKKGIALFKFQGKIGGADVIFGQAGDSTLLGAFTLEALGLALDPLKRELKPLPLILACVHPVPPMCSAQKFRFVPRPARDEVQGWWTKSRTAVRDFAKFR